MTPLTTVAPLLGAPAASTGAEHVDTIFAIVIAITGVVTVGVFVVMGAFVWRYRYRAGVNETGRDVPGSTRLEIGWTVATTVVFAGIFVLGAWGFAERQHVPAGRDVEEILVVAKQWMWKFQHSGGRREIAVLHVPVGRVVRLSLTSEDVIHSFFVPAFRLKQDVLPGRTTTSWFEATTPGTYRIACAEYCGAEHGQMRAEVVVMPPEAYDAWLERREPGDAPLSAAGREVFARHDCATCHETHANKPAPPLEGLFGRRRVFEDGSALVADEAYLRESVLEPSARIVAGYAVDGRSPMPSFAGVLTNEELFQLVYYLRTLEDATGVSR